MTSVILGHLDNEGVHQKQKYSRLCIFNGRDIISHIVQHDRILKSRSQKISLGDLFLYLKIFALSFIQVFLSSWYVCVLISSIKDFRYIGVTSLSDTGLILAISWKTLETKKVMIWCAKDLAFICELGDWGWCFVSFFWGKGLTEAQVFNTRQRSASMKQQQLDYLKKTWTVTIPDNIPENLTPPLRWKASFNL